MTFKLMLIATLSLSASANAAQSAEVSKSVRGPIDISANGDGTWYVRCDIQGRNYQGMRELSKARPSYHDDQMTNAACHYESNKRGLTIKVVGTGWECPFKGAPEGDCMFVDKVSGSGTFRIRRSN